MPFEIVRNDITKMNVDAIVNAANRSLLGGGGVDGAIHRAAGPELLAECSTLGGCETGEAKITKGYRLPARYVIHTVGPIWYGGHSGEKELLSACYRHSLELAVENGCESVAFPMISAGAYGYPGDQAMAVAVETITGFLMDHDLMVYLVVFGRDSFLNSKKLFRDVKEYIDDVYAETRIRRRRENIRENLWHSDETTALDYDMEICQPLMGNSCPEAAEPKVQASAPAPAPSLVDRKLFSKIRSNPAYKPSKPTVLAFAVALELTLPETKTLLKKAGFALTRSSEFDLVLEYCIKHRIYNIYDINEVLFGLDMPLLGSGMG